ncbi:hypothetical protein LCGC14_1151950 [marine sediment metagenome]|uniref:ASCH domain-containing protein n=1 Tax=marine sediment metagenome TaxID=412755 RepID=A0A0F9LV53_9ZZZZ
MSHLSEIIDNKTNEDNKLKIKQQKLRVGVHLAIFIEPYLQYIIEGKKTIESRFSVNHIAPFKKIFQGDLILLKKSGGFIVGFCLVNEVWFYHLNPSIWNKIRNSFESELCIKDPQFWESKQHALYATLIKLGEFNAFSPIKFQKKDRRGWIILKPNETELTKNKLEQINKTKSGLIYWL